MGKHKTYEIEELFKSYESCRFDRKQLVVHTCKGYVHFIPSGAATVKVFLTEYPEFDIQRDSPLPVVE